ncbi:TPA: hypothetical protein DDZ86_03110 [Candidatus Dependentiae bacterium]|nr:MAG: TonB-system energizer ExbB [candidate division TM6 bacterium GW2011_GWF2_43_87]HBL98605.1 hypothetical protein [Candidatus Dependentiae bacterium]
MENIFVANSLWGVIRASSLLSKVILFLASMILLVCLFIFIYKMLLIREKLRQVALVRSSLHSAESLNDVLSMGAVLKGTLPGTVLGRGLKALKALLQGKDGQKNSLSGMELELLRDSLDQAHAEAMQKEYEYIPVLSVSAAVAPLVGLFGTISGLIQSFIGIAQARSTDITTIAPGIAEALLTTFAGLVVAIPAFIMFHYLSNAARRLDGELGALVYQFEWIVKNVLKD